VKKKWQKSVKRDFCLSRDWGVPLDKGVPPMHLNSKQSPAPAPVALREKALRKSGRKALKGIFV
ncbi:MAG: hypothetical protein MJZ86_09855, partial [Bacteroidales bacterium]|nr:hypothetical protein [Bacteroidales bacterium]